MFSFIELIENSMLRPLLFSAFASFCDISFVKSIMEVNFSIKFELFASKISFILESKELNFSSNKDVVLSKPSPSLFVNSSI